MALHVSSSRITCPYLLSKTENATRTALGLNKGFCLFCIVIIAIWQSLWDRVAKFGYFPCLDALQWRYNECDLIVYPAVCSGRSKKTSMFRVTGLCGGNYHRWTLNSLHKRPVTRTRFPFDDVMMITDVPFEIAGQSLFLSIWKILL